VTTPPYKVFSPHLLPTDYTQTDICLTFFCSSALSSRSMRGSSFTSAVPPDRTEYGPSGLWVLMPLLCTHGRAFADDHCGWTDSQMGLAGLSPSLKVVTWCMMARPYWMVGRWANPRPNRGEKANTADVPKMHEQTVRYGGNLKALWATGVTSMLANTIPLLLANILVLVSHLFSKTMLP
jgi:hypothetical protein